MKSFPVRGESWFYLDAANAVVHSEGLTGVRVSSGLELQGDLRRLQSALAWLTGSFSSCFEREAKAIIDGCSTSAAVQSQMEMQGWQQVPQAWLNLCERPELLGSRARRHGAPKPPSRLEAGPSPTFRGHRYASRHRALHTLNCSGGPSSSARVLYSMYILEPSNDGTLDK